MHLSKFKVVGVWEFNCCGDSLGKGRWDSGLEVAFVRGVRVDVYSS